MTTKLASGPARHQTPEDIFSALRLAWCSDCRTAQLFEAVSLPDDGQPVELACVTCGAGYLAAEVSHPSR